MPANWPALITKAEKLLGGPAPFINLSSLLSSEAGFLAARARRLAATIDHPFFSAVRACLHGKSVSSLFPFSQNFPETTKSTASSPYPSGGLIVLLVGQCRAGNAAGSTVLSNQHRSLAELFETVHMAITIHKSLVHPNKLERNWPNKASDDKHDEWIKNIELGNKLATLAGDVLLASVSTTLAGFHNAKVVDLVSEAIGDMIQAEFNSIALEFVHGRASTETAVSEPEHLPAVASVKDNWLSYIGACRGSILGSCCQSAVLLSEARLKLPQLDDQHTTRTDHKFDVLARQLGRDWATLIRLMEERNFITRNWYALNGQIPDLLRGTNDSRHTIDIAPGSSVNYIEGGLPEPTLIDAYLGEQVPLIELHLEQQEQRHTNSVVNITPILHDYSCLGLHLSDQLKDSFNAFQSAVLSSQSASERATVSAVELLREMVLQLSADAAKPIPEMRIP